ncbi:hypothetical protein [Leptospira levettii]|uniref:Lipoprotein n=1 Tax=Leptospira levettii TaxID=2023178 RepID=A0ABY2MU72_9LEPT|nr:hypothetical protein [Leptospira levettii]TGL75416.1 hypothetical protein EHQ60_00395 [Leptospira levettii]
MKKVFILIFSFLASCIQEPNPSIEKSAILFGFIYSNQEGCKFNSKNGNLDNEFCSFIKFGDCSTSRQEIINKNLKNKIISGLENIALTINQCTIDAYNEIQFIKSLSENANLYFAKKNVSPTENSYFPNLNCDGFQLVNRMTNTELTYLEDPSIYLAIFAQNNNCSLLIPLSELERVFVSNYKKGEKLIFTSRL